ncbi:hypothetical protein ElyMa_000303700 [Elysia marginata]|uniref:Ig-like domain-containing protein n=1 Tax=Elysia marginata TaxID=1093978 RepID=A0AAV4F9L6_9GAST|nr:hypothetical protein ElyMa_000303700 [Elysia marginata]
MFHSTIIVEPFCDPVEEGQSTSLTCDVDTAACSIQPVTRWRAQAKRRKILMVCSPHTCFGGFERYFPTTISSTRSTLNIRRVSRVTPFNMETKWRCSPCSRGYVTVCDKLQVYGEVHN